MRRSAAPFSAGLLAALCCAAACAGEPPGPPGPNLLLISLDSTRADRLGCYGYRPSLAPERSSTPHLDALAAAGVRLSEARSTTSWTLPSHMSLFTGQTEVVHAVEFDHLSLAAEIPSLPELLGRAGWRTAGFFSGPYLEGRFGFARGFDRYQACYGPELAQAYERYDRAGRLREQEQAAGVPEGRRMELWKAWRQAELEVEKLSHRDVSSRSVTDAALAEIREAARSEKPWFVFAHYFDPHYDYAPPAPWDRQFDPDYAGEIDGADYWADPRISVPDTARPGERVRKVSDRDLEHLLALYDGEIAWTDDQVGRLVAALDELGLAEDTLVVVSSDHGDEFFEHRSLGHRRTLYEEVLRVPLLLRWPGHLPAGRSVAGTASNADVLPTVLELFGLPAPRELASRSLLPLIDGREDGSDRTSLARIVTLYNGYATPDAARPAERVFAQQLQVHEAYFAGPLKVTRERSWVEVPRGMTPEQTAMLQRQSEIQFARERLHWIDLERAPAERDEDYSADFSDPRARQALDRFREEYARQLELRVRALSVGRDPRGTGALQGLGYAGGGDASGIQSEMVRLPPPGQPPPGQPSSVRAAPAPPASPVPPASDGR